MKFNKLRKIGLCGMLVVVISSGLTSYAAQDEKETAGKTVVALLRAFESDMSDPRTLNEFFDAIIAILEDPIKAAEFKKEYPGINVQALIAALKKVRSKTSAVVIGLALKPFFKYLPEDLQDISKLWSAINRRTAKK